MVKISDWCEFGYGSVRIRTDAIRTARTRAPRKNRKSKIKNFQQGSCLRLKEDTGKKQ